MRSARAATLEALIRIEAGAFARDALEGVLRGGRLGREDRALATELTFGATRRRNTLDWIISRYADRSPKRMDPIVRNILRMAFYQLRYLDRIPARAVCHEAVELARLRGRRSAAGFVNAIIRSYLRDPERAAPAAVQGDSVRQLALTHSHPEWLVTSFLEWFGPAAARDMLSAGNRVPPLTIRVNRLKLTAPELVARLAAEGAAAEPGRFLPEAVRLLDADELTSLAAFRDGLFTIQDEGAMVVSHVVDPRPGELIIDACSAPGGKSTHMAELMHDCGRVLAWDVDGKRLELVRDNYRRLGIKSIETRTGDAVRIGEALAGRADRILVDAPCSGLGVLARRADARWRRRPADIDNLSRMQGEILRGVAGALKPGGVLVYSTCTVAPAENEAVIDAFLTAVPGFRPDPVPGLPAGLAGGGGPVGRLQLLPHVHGTDGFFIQRLRREP